MFRARIWRKDNPERQRHVAWTGGGTGLVYYSRLAESFVESEIVFVGLHESVDLVGDDLAFLGLPLPQHQLRLQRVQLGRLASSLGLETA